MSVVLITGPTSEPVSLADAKLQNGLPPDDDSNHLKTQQVHTRLRRAIRSARVLCENYTRRAFVTQTWQWNLDMWPFDDGRYERRAAEYGNFGPDRRGSILHIPKPPFQSVVSFNYVDVGGETQTVTSWGAYQLDLGSETQSARIAPPPFLPWPPLYPTGINNVQLQFIAGYGDAGASVPQNILDAILLTQQYLYDGDPLKNGLPEIVKDMLNPYRNLVA